MESSMVPSCSDDALLDTSLLSLNVSKSVAAQAWAPGAPGMADNVVADEDEEPADEEAMER